MCRKALEVADFLRRWMGTEQLGEDRSPSNITGDQQNGGGKPASHPHL